MAMAIPSYAAKLGRGKVGLISSSNQLARKKYLGENNAIHSVVLTVEGLVVCTLFFKPAVQAGGMVFF